MSSQSRRPARESTPEWPETTEGPSDARAAIANPAGACNGRCEVMREIDPRRRWFVVPDPDRDAHRLAPHT